MASSEKKTSSTAGKSDSFICIWLDQNVEATQDNLVTQQELRALIATLRTFTSLTECERYVTKTTKEKLVLIVSGGLGRQIVPRVHDLPQVSSIYIYCQDKEANRQWASQHSKILGIHVNSEELLENVSKTHPLRLRRTVDPRISVISRSMESRNASFLWFQLFIEVLLRMTQKRADRQELMKILRTHCANDAHKTQIIDLFEKDYKPSDAISWYSRESPIYHVLNCALCQQDFDTLIAYRWFISDIAAVLTDEHEKMIRANTKNQPLRVYRGQVIEKQELQLITESVGDFLSMTSFLSTSLKQSVALAFAREAARSNANASAILFEITIDLQKKTKAFSNIAKMSRHKNEDEVLIMLGALFRIDSVTEEKNSKITIIRVSLADEDEFELKDVLQAMKEKIEGETSLDSLGKLLLRMGENQRALKCYQRMLDESLVTVANARLGLGWANLRCDKNKESLGQLEQALAIRENLLGKDHPDVGEVHSFLGEAHLANDNYPAALKSLTAAIHMQANNTSGSPTQLCASYDSIATTYTCLAEYDLALKYYQKALDLRQRVLSASDPLIGASYKNIGWMFNRKKEYAKAMGYFQQALEILHKTLPGNHPSIVEINKYINELKGNVGRPQ